MVTTGRMIRKDKTGSIFGESLDDNFFSFGADFMRYGKEIEMREKQKNPNNKKEFPFWGERKRKKGNDKNNKRDRKNHHIEGRTTRREVHLSPTEAKQKASLKEAPTCPYCGKKATIKTAKEYKGREDDYCYWVCDSCEEVYVTTISGSFYPSGRLADPKLRKARIKAHQIVEFKKKELHFNRSSLQLWMAAKLGIPEEKAKIGILSEEELNQVVFEANKEYYQKKYAEIFTIKE